MKDQFLQFWNDEISRNKKLISYNQFKTTFGYENYLDVLQVRKYRHLYGSFRLSCHDLEIEQGRYRGILRENRLCKFCLNVVEDEFHFLLVCSKFNDLRNELIPTKYVENPNIHKFNILMASKNIDIIKLVSKYLFLATERRKQALQSL